MRCIIVTVALATAASACQPESRGRPSRSAADAITLNVVTVSDWHAQLDPVQTRSSDGSTVEIGGASVLATYLERERQSDPETLFFTAGDAFGGSPPLSGLMDEEPAVKALGLMGLAADTFGNHNFDRGIDHLQRMIHLAGYRFVSTNLENLKDNLRGVASPYLMLKVKGIDVAVLGLTNPDAPELTFPGRMGSLTVSDPATAGSDAAAAARAAGAEVVIALAHLGVTGSDDHGRPMGPLMELAADLRGVDVLAGDHTNEKVNQTVGSMLVVENLSRGQTYARISITYDPRDGKVTRRSAEHVVPNAAGVARNPAIEAMLAPYRDQLALRLDEKLGTATERFPRDGNEERLGESALGNLIADAMRERYGTEIAVVNGGGIRAALPSSYAPRATGLQRSAPPYDLVTGDIYTVLPFGNEVVTRHVTGEQIWAMAEHGVSGLPATAGSFMQVSGFSFTYRASAPAGSRVQSIQLDGGAPVLRNGAAYTAAVPDFLNQGGDGYAMLADGQGTTREIMADVLAEHIRGRGAVAPSVSGRIAEVP